MTGKYDDILNLPHHVSDTRPQMPMLDRAAQFSPFAALTGYEAAVKETARLTEARVELDENAKAELDQKLRLLMEYLQEQPQVAITYFQPDSRKEGGAYLTVTGVIKRIRELERMVELTDGTRIPISDILDLESRVFKALESEYADDPPTMD